ncbi:MAG: subclass B3 metallo-beta-lactamase [Bryobacteraceae bacterium]|jgi:metallo-beta-lactamase class B
MTRSFALLLALTIAARAESFVAKWAQPQEPFRIAGNIYYVGSNELACFLITTPQGHILINTGYERMAPQLRASVKKLGFKFADIRYLLTGQVHDDHVAGFAAAREASGAKVLVMQGDDDIMEHGGRGDFRFDGEISYRACHVDRVLHDGDTVSLGGTTLVAHLTPGHTKGCTTWTTTVTDKGRVLNVVIVGGVSVNPGVKLLHNPHYAGIVDDYARTFRTLRALSCDVFLGSHGNYYSMAEKLARMKAGAAENPFIDPAGYRHFIDESEARFERLLAEETKARSR